MFTRNLKFINRTNKQILQFKRSESDHKLNSKIIQEVFGFNRDKAINYVQRHRLARVDPENLTKSIIFCQKLCFDNQEILENPILLRAHPTTLDQYYTVMTEGGFIDIDLALLARFRSLYRKTIGFLKEAEFIAPGTDVAARFITYLNPRPDNFYVNTKGDAESWSDVHFLVLTQYLKWRLKITDADIEKLVRTHTGICRKSFQYLCENIAMAESLGFTPEKMVKYGYVLHRYPKYTKTVLEKYPTIAGADMRKAMRMYPKLATISPSNIEKIYNILKEHNIPDEAIQKRMNVFQLSPETVKLRLKELERVADLKVLLYNPNILKLVIHHNRAKSRLSFLKQLQLKCAGVSVLGNDNSKFDIHVREGRDANTANDIYSFLEGILNKDIDRLESNLKRHPFYLQVPLVSMEATYNYLAKNKYTVESIFKVIHVLLYPVDKVKKAFEQVDSFAKQTGRELNQVKRLNLVLYFIEKEHHFTGDGVWMKNDLTEEGNL